MIIILGLLIIQLILDVIYIRQAADRNDQKMVDVRFSCSLMINEFCIVAVGLGIAFGFFPLWGLG